MDDISGRCNNGGSQRVLQSVPMNSYPSLPRSSMQQSDLQTTMLHQSSNNHPSTLPTQTTAPNNTLHTPANPAFSSHSTHSTARILTNMNINTHHLTTHNPLNGTQTKPPQDPESKIELIDTPTPLSSTLTTLLTPKNLASLTNLPHTHAQTLHTTLLSALQARNNQESNLTTQRNTLLSHLSGLRTTVRRDEDTKYALMDLFTLKMAGMFRYEGGAAREGVQGEVIHLLEEMRGVSLRIKAGYEDMEGVREGLLDVDNERVGIERGFGEGVVRVVMGALGIDTDLVSLSHSSTKQTTPVSSDIPLDHQRQMARGTYQAGHGERFELAHPSSPNNEQGQSSEQSNLTTQNDATEKKKKRNYRTGPKSKRPSKQDVVDRDDRDGKMGTEEHTSKPRPGPKHPSKQDAAGQDGDKRTTTGEGNADKPQNEKRGGRWQKKGKGKGRQDRGGEGEGGGDAVV